MTIELPYPPSVNHYWRFIPGRQPMISRGGRAYAESVRAALRLAGFVRMDGPLSVNVDLYPPDRKKRDVDNVMKALLDALQKGGAYKDDSQIDELRVSRQEIVVPGGAAVVEIRRA